MTANNTEVFYCKFIAKGFVPPCTAKWSNFALHTSNRANIALISQKNSWKYSNTQILCHFDFFL